jgi:TolB-like protein/DNA-binding winged helix-turn-helix (wHTH) protein/Tfp pilus assembly protein PilF
MEASQTGPTYRFGDLAFDPSSGELHKRGQKVRLQEQPFQILMLLLARPGEVVTREQVRQALWPGDTFVDFDAGLNSAIKRLRDALDDSAEEPRFVETLPRRGYRFIARVEAPLLPAPEPTATEIPAKPARRSGFSGAAAPLTALAAVLVVLAVSLTRDRWRGDHSGSVSITSIAVLPFENLGGDPEQDYFVDGMTDAVITNLAQVRALRVISRTSVTQYKQTDKLLPRIAEDLNVDAVVEGTVMRSGDRVRITAQLIHAATDRHLWARTYERELRDVLALQAELAAAIAQAVQVKVQPEEHRRLAARGTVDPEAYDAYLKGRFFWNKRSTQNIAKAVEYFQQAIDRDPTYAPAYSGLSDAYRMSGLQTLPPREYMPKAEAAARKALALDETLAEAHSSLAGVLYRYHWDWQGADREFQRSLELDPSYAEGHRAYAIYLLTVRRHEEAVAEARRARELSPLSPVINVELATALVRVGRYDEAIQQVQKTLEIDPKFFRAHMMLALAYEGQGDRARAVAVFEKVLPREGRGANHWLGYLYAVTGRRDQALEVVARLEKRSRERYVNPQSIALVYLGLGDRDQAMAWLEKAYEDRSFEMLGFSGTVFDELEEDPRFQDLLRRMRLPTAVRASNPRPRT